MTYNVFANRLDVEAEQALEISAEEAVALSDYPESVFLRKIDNLEEIRTKIAKIFKPRCEWSDGEASIYTLEVVDAEKKKTITVFAAGTDGIVKEFKKEA